MLIFVGNKQLNKLHHFDTKSLTTLKACVLAAYQTIVLFCLTLSFVKQILELKVLRNETTNGLITIPVKRLIAFANDFSQTCRKQSDFDSLFKRDRQIFPCNFSKISVLLIITSQTPRGNRACRGYDALIMIKCFRQSQPWTWLRKQFYLVYMVQGWLGFLSKMYIAKFDFWAVVQRDLTVCPF